MNAFDDLKRGALELKTVLPAALVGAITEWFIAGFLGRIYD